MPPQEIWNACYQVLRPGGFLLSFGHPRFYHRLALQLEQSGFIVKDCLCWQYATSFPRSYNVSKELKKKGDLSYTKWIGTGTVLKTSWEPIILVQKPIEKNIVNNLLAWETGVLNIDQCRIPYESEEDKKSLESFFNFAGEDHGDERYFSMNKGGQKQVNIHPDGRWPSNVLWTDTLDINYNRFFLIPKPSETEKRSYNDQDTVKPVELMVHLVKLITLNPDTTGITSTVLDSFMGSGSTGIACKMTNRNFIGYENNESAFRVAERRLSEKCLVEICD